MVTEQKDTVYIDVDDEITAIIDKVSSSTAKIVALVLPKRAAALQSIVNMKLLKRSAKDSGKNIVLISSEAGLLPIAGAVGVYVAKTLQSKPEIPPAPDTSEADEALASIPEDGQVDSAKTVGELAGTAAVEDTVEIDDEVTAQAKPAAKPKKKGDKKPKIPNFEKFRLKLFLAAAAILLLIGIWYVAVFMAGKANIVITTKTEAINTDLDFTASTNAKTTSVKDKIIPAELVETKKQDDQTAAATGEKDVGEKAKGTITVKNCETSNAENLPAGSKFTSSSNKVFLTNSAASVAPATVDGGLVCGTTNIPVTAQQSGESYNIGSTSYTNGSLSGEYTITGTKMTGGTTKLVKVVSQQDVDNAKAKLDTGDEAIADELEAEVSKQGLMAVKDTLKTKDESTTVSPKVGEEASEVKVSYSASFSMLGINRDDLKAVLAESIKDQIDPDKQQIQDDGLDQATFSVKSTKPDGSSSISVSTILAVGPNINTEQLTADIAGKKRGETENIIKSLPGVTEVSVDYSPFWISKTPKNPAKTNISFKESE